MRSEKEKINWSRKIKYWFSHHNLREVARTLNSFNFIEIAIILYGCFILYDLISWYKLIMTVEHFNGVAFWGTVGSIAAAVIGAVKYINDTAKKD